MSGFLLRVINSESMFLIIPSIAAENSFLWLGGYTYLSDTKSMISSNTSKSLLKNPASAILEPSEAKKLAKYKMAKIPARKLNEYFREFLFGFILNF